MTMQHKAYAFDHARFEAELAPLLLAALETKNEKPLVAFIDAQRAHLVDPYAGEALAPDWQRALENGDVQELGDFALTKYYDVELDLGLDEDWEALADLLEKSGSSGAFLLGAELGKGDDLFDPGQQGAYFQTEAEVEQGLKDLQALLEKSPPLSADVAPLLGMYQQAAKAKRGLYVTF